MIGGEAAGQGAGPGQHKTGHVGEVVAGVGEEGERVDPPAVERLDGDIADIERNADGKSTVKVRLPVGVGMRMSVFTHGQGTCKG